MAIEVNVPDIGDFTDVPVLTVLVSVGDTVSEEDPLIELESDKATMEVPSPAAGKVKEIKISEGDTVSEGTLIMVLEGEDAGSAEAAPKEEAEPAEEAPKAAAPAAGATPAQSTAPAPVTDAGFGKAHASPSVRAFARQLEIDLAKVNGSGRKGRILREDVTNYLKSTTAAAPAGASGGAQGGMGIPPIPAVDFLKFGPVE